MARIHSYVVEHDVGFAPNPFWGVCTLANCKPNIRKHAKIGDWIVGTGSATADLVGHLIYWMVVDKIITFDQYWSDQKYSLKKPDLTGSRIQHYGDNIYHTGAAGEILQEDSFHSKPDGVLGEKDLKTDTGKTHNVLVGSKFCYLGKKAIVIPEELKYLIKSRQGHKSNFSAIQFDEIVQWLEKVAPFGVLGEPVRW